MQVKIKGPSGRQYLMSGPEGDHQVKHWQQGHFYECADDTQLLMWMWNNREKYGDYFKRIIDIGASLGNHSVFFAGELGAYVRAIEPSTPVSVGDNMEGNGLFGPGVFTFTRHHIIGLTGNYTPVHTKDNVGMTKYTHSPYGEKAWRLRYCCRYFHPTCIKIDCEGMDVDVLIASLSVIKKSRPMILIETDYPDTIEELLPNHERLDVVLNATPTYVFVPI